MEEPPPRMEEPPAPASPPPPPAAGSVPFLSLFSFADALDAFLMLLGTFAAIAQGSSMPLLAFLFGQITNAFGENDRSHVLHAVSQISLSFVYLAIGSMVASFSQVTFWMVTGERQAARIRGLYLKAILRQDVAFFDKESSTGEVIGRMSADTILIQDAIGEKVGKFLQLFSTFIGGFVVAFVRGWKLTLLMLVSIPLLAIAGAIMTVLLTKATSKGQEAYAQAGDLVEQVIGAIRTVASFTGEKKAIQDYNKELKKAYKASILQGLANGLGVGTFMAILFASYGLAFWYGSKLIVNEGYSGGAVLNVIFAVLMGSMSLGQASPSLNAFAAGRAAAYKMFECIHRVPDIDSYDMKGRTLDVVKGDIEFNNVDFSYPARPDVQIFSKLTLHIPQGLTAALVGESGSGKSTVISLIERFYDPQGGAVLLDGVDIKHLQLKWLRQQIGLVSQEPVLFGTSIKDNIRYGKDEATLEEIQSAAHLANAANFITSLPQGYNTMVGEHGTQLSGGQKQRIALARAILKNPSVLLLDEATSALDAESERLVQEALDQVMVNRTTVIVAHRLTTIRNADLIVVVQRGAIVETGKHTELLESPLGAYAQLIHLQEMHHEGLKQNGDDMEVGISSAIESPRSARKSGTSFRRSLSRTSSLGGISRSDSIRPAEIEADEKLAHSQRKGFFKWFGRGSVEDPETGEKKSVPDVSIFRIAALNKAELPIYLLGTLAAATNGIIFPIYALLFSSILKVFFEPPHKLRKDADFWASMFVLLACVAFIVAPIQLFCFAVGGSRLILRVRQITFEKVLQQEISWFDETGNSSGSISARLSADATHVKSVVGDALSVTVQNLATIAAGLIIAFSANWQLSLVVLAIVPLLSLQGMMQIRFMKGFSADAKVMYEEASQVASDAVGSIRTVASFCAEDKVLRLYHNKCKLPLQKGVRQGLLSGSTFGLSNFVMFATNGFCFWFGAKLVQDGKASFKEVFKVIFAITMSAFSVSQSTSLLSDISNVKAAVNSVFALIDRKSKIDSSDDSGLVPETVTGNIDFKHVSFKYPSRPEAQILNNLCLSVAAGKTLALVGESGCGKSTIISLLQRFYDPDTGNILLDGIDVKSLQLRWLRQQMGMVSQEPVLFNISIRENIVYGINIPITDEQVVAAAKASNAHTFILDLPEGYSTLVGERGIQLSGGQKQRVAIARAIIKNPRILLLDEATSALDAESEHVVQEALDTVMANRSAIVIAHRLSTIQNADVIAVVKNGAIIEHGQHDGLMRLKEGAYASLVKLHMSPS